MSLLTKLSNYTLLSDEEVCGLADIINDINWDALEAMASEQSNRIDMGRAVARTFLSGEDGEGIAPSDKFRVGCMVASNHGH